MNKQELITRIEKIEYEHLHYNSPESMLLEQKNKILDLVEQLDEPQKPVVPKFVAEYLNYCMGNEWTLREALITGKNQLPDYLHEAIYWLNDSMNQNIFAEAWLFGYEVEKEAMYRVIMPNPQSKGENVLVLRRTQQGTITVDKVKEITAILGERMDLTEEEIKSVDERYLVFAVPVEEVAEG